MDFWGESHIWVESICTYTIIFQISSIVFDESCSLVFPSSPSCRLQVFPWSIHAGLEPMCKQKPSWMLLLCCIIFAYLSSPSQSTFLLVMPDVATQIWGPKSEASYSRLKFISPVFSLQNFKFWGNSHPTMYQQHSTAPPTYSGHNSSSSSSSRISSRGLLVRGYVQTCYKIGCLVDVVVMFPSHFPYKKL